MGKVYRCNKGLLCCLVQQSSLVTDRPCLLHSVVVANSINSGSCVITGDAVPNINGVYVYQGLFNAKPYFYCVFTGYYIWYFITTDVYAISTALGSAPSFHWYISGTNFEGYYNPVYPAAWYPLVSYIPIISADVYNGVNDKGIIKLHLIGVSLGSYLINYKIPVLFVDGLYIDMPVAGLSCTVVYELLE